MLRCHFKFKATLNHFTPRYVYVTVASRNWETPLIPFHWGVFQGDTMSPIVFLLTFNPLLKLFAHLNQGYDNKLELKPFLLWTQVHM